ncbi:MAG: MFS transporter [Rhizobiales bacterium]|nr:MFS transporter [Hyphomicrobiales bacterium]
MSDKTVRTSAALPAGIWALGMTSFFMDMSSELIHALLPVFLVTTLGASVLTLGILEGIAEAIASITKVFSGVLSDWLGKRKLLTVIGYGMAAFTKPFFPMADSIVTVFTARFTDRVGKGIRGAPRDALIADIVPVAQRGAAYGLRQSLDTAGAVAGPLLAILLMLWLSDNIRLVLWFAVIPAFLALAILVIWVREPDHVARDKSARRAMPFRKSEIMALGAPYWRVVAIGAILTLARFSEAFLILRAQSTGLTIAFVPLVMVVMSAAYALSAYPAGLMADVMDRKSLMVAGFAVLILADLVLAVSSTPLILFAGVALWGLHMGLTQGLLSTLIADAAPATLRGSAFGVFNFICGIVLLAASVLAGALWDMSGPAATFLAGAAITLMGLIALLLFAPRATETAS